MKKSLKKFLPLTACVSFFFTISSTVYAEPVAPLSKYSKDGLKLIKQQNKSLEDLKKEIPSQEKVGIPVYPNATYASSMDGGDSLPPSINLISSDPAEKVMKWYRENLEGWSYSEKLNLFYESREEEPQIAELFEGKYQTVAVMEENGKGLDLMFLDIPDVKTRIQFIYKPKK